MAKDFSIRLREMRKKRGISQDALADATTIPRPAISNFELGKRSPSMENLGRLADALGVSLDYLLGRSTVERGGVSKDLKQLVDVASELLPGDVRLLTTIATHLRDRTKTER